MSISTNLISGLSSGFDWRSMIDQLIAIDRGRVNLVADKKSKYESQLAEWRGVNTMLLSLKTAANALTDEEDFNLFTSSTTSNTTTSASDLLTVSTSSTASAGTYNIMVDNLAEVEKISSNTYTATDTALSLSGDILISGKMVQITATDTLANIKGKINALNTGDDPSQVTATIVTHSSTDYHLVLTSDVTGDEGIDIREGSLDGVLQSMGFIGASTETTTPTSDGAKSALFSDSTTAVGTLLELTSAPGNTTVQIGNEDVVINLSSHSITTIAQNIDAIAGLSAFVVSETVSGETKYRIDISGTTSFSDTDNVLQILGIEKGTYGSVQEVHSGSVNYASGGADIVAGTTFANIFTGILRGDVENHEISGQGGEDISADTQWNWINTGGDANDIAGGGAETIRIEGTDHDGTGVDQTYTINDNTETLSNFLSWVETQYGGSSKADAYFDSDGRLILEDLQSGSSELAITNVTYGGTNLNFSTTEPFGNNITNDDTISISGTRGDGTTVSTITYTITDKTTDTIQDLLDKIHDGDGGDDAFGETSRTATPTVSGGKIIITDDTAGDSQLSLTLIANNELGGTLNFGDISVTTEGRDMQLVAGEDAQITVDGAIITKDSNTITDIIEGATLNLVGASATTTVTLNIERDLASIKSKIQGIADAYNAIIGYINTQLSYDEDEEETGGILFGDGTLRSVKSELISTVTETITGLSSDYNRLPLIGITLGDDLNMTIDDDDLTDALETNFDYVRKLFAAYGSAPSSLFQYVGHTDDTEGGSYTVDITQAATQTTTTGSNELNGELVADETLTITDYATTGREAIVNLTIGMDIDDVVNAINSEFANEYTKQIQGDADTGFTSSTLWSAVEGAANDEVITFSGKNRSGVSVSSNYIIITTDTIGDLLEAIEDMFDDEVTAKLDDDNKLVITDKLVGDSQLAFNIDTSEVSGLDFGTLSTATEGRYTMPIVASKTAENKLLLTHNSYGSGQIITVSESGSALGFGGAPDPEYFGKDVVGTINGEAATGDGQTLTLASASSNNADGLSVMYTGTGTTNTTFTLTLGIAELLERQLGFITDTTDGYVGFKQTSLRNSIDAYEDRIEEMEASLNRKMETMINRFVAMELSLSKMQNQSQWLAAQLGASFSGWKL